MPAIPYIIHTCSLIGYSLRIPRAQTILLEVLGQTAAPDAR
ncbi:MAG: hypothetical protein K0Q46_3191 [Rhodococcus erythropolis]|jgi:hypothetical protein|nr:hypothetical protein [Rhodococcus erythropolis]